MKQRLKKVLKALLRPNNNGKSNNQNPSIDLEPLYKLNQELGKEQVKSKTIEDLTPFSVSFQRIQNSQKEAINILKEHGLLIVTNLFEDEEVEKLYEGCKTTIEEALQKPNDNSQEHEDQNIVITSLGDRFKSYRDLANYHKTVFNIRSGSADNGMIDVFNFDLAFRHQSGRLRERFSDKVILDIIAKATGQNYHPKNLNIYYNKNITNTRGFHADSYGKGQIKSFIYLSDVLSLDKGPYCFIPGTNQNKEIENINKYLVKHSNRKKTDTFYFDPRKAYPILGKKGTMIISDQSGIHRGFPQNEGEERLMAVMNLVPEQ